jgi:hypothetical protein
MGRAADEKSVGEQGKTCRAMGDPATPAGPPATLMTRRGYLDLGVDHRIDAFDRLSDGDEDADGRDGDDGQNESVLDKRLAAAANQRS